MFCTIINDVKFILFHYGEYKKLADYEFLVFMIKPYVLIDVKSVKS